MDRERPSSLPLDTGGESGGGAYPNDAPKGRFVGGQSEKDYHGPKKGGAGNAARGAGEDDANSEEKD